MHINSVNQWELVNYYAQAKVFVLPSREEGLALVQAQALACGLVCSQNTGGSTLREFLDDKKWIIEMPEYTSDCLAECITQALLLYKEQPEGKHNYAGNSIKNLTWEAYGKRYSEFLSNLKYS